METDSKKILTRAFQSLELFSVPGLGTFRRSYHPAHIDRTTKVITPPGERFVFEKGEDYTGRLESFVAKTFEAGDLAKDKVKEVRSWIIRELKKGKPLNFPGIGKLELQSNKEVKFVAETGADASGDFFGLQPVGFTLGQPKAKAVPPKESTPDLKKKATVAVAATTVAAAATAAVATAANTSTQAQAAVENPPLVETVAPPKRKSRAWVWLILVLLLVGAGTAGVIWREQVREQLVTWGWMSPSGGEAGGGGSTDGAGLVDGGDAGDGDEVTDGTDFTAPEEEGDGTDGTDEATDEVVEVEETPPVADTDEVVGNYAQNGVYYLIVASGKDAASMKKMRRQMGGKIIRASYEGNYYRLANFQSSNKDEVIEKMVASKDKFPNSWIFWKGM